MHGRRVVFARWKVTFPTDEYAVSSYKAFTLNMTKSGPVRGIIYKMLPVPKIESENA